MSQNLLTERDFLSLKNITAKKLPRRFDFHSLIIEGLRCELSIASKVHDGDGSAILATMDRLNRVLPLWESEESGLDPRIQSLIEQRSRARKARDFALADELRNRIFDLGYLVEDTKDGVRWKKR